MKKPHRGKLTERIAIITGGTSGIGKATAALFASEGAIVVITGRRSELGKTVVDGIEGFGGQTCFVYADHTILKDCEQVIEKVNNASDWGLVRGKRAVAYCASKGAELQMTRAMAMDYADEEIRINAVCPGDTFVERWQSDGYFRGETSVDQLSIIEDAKDLPMGRVANPNEIAGAILFLASDDSSYVTGVALPVDGGNTAR